MTNPRTVEFERKIQSMFHRALGLAMNEAIEKGISPYDVKIDFEELIEEHMTFHNDATEQPTLRAFKNLENREVFIQDASERERTFHLNPKLADQDVFVDRNPKIWFKMPKNAIPKPKTEE